MLLTLALIPGLPSNNLDLNLVLEITSHIFNAAYARFTTKKNVFVLHSKKTWSWRSEKYYVAFKSMVSYHRTSLCSGYSWYRPRERETGTPAPILFYTPLLYIYKENLYLSIGTKRYRKKMRNRKNRQADSKTETQI